MSPTLIDKDALDFMNQEFFLPHSLADYMIMLVRDMLVRRRRQAQDPEEPVDRR